MEERKKLFLIPAEFAEIVGCSKHLVYEAVRQNRIRHFKLGSRIFIPRQEVDRLSNGGTGEADTK